MVVVDEVVTEIRYPPTSNELQQALADGWLIQYRLTSVHELRLVIDRTARTPRLGAGEIASLAACLANGWILATDDRDARRVARTIASDRPVAISGTLGLLVTAVREGAVERHAASDLFRAMVKQGYRSPIARLEDLL